MDSTSAPAVGQGTLTRVFAGLVVVFLLASVSISTAAPSEKIKVRVSGLPNPSLTTPTAVAAQRVVDRFLELNPDVKLVSAEGLQIETMASEVTTIMMIAGDIAPDVLNMNFRSMDTFVSQNMVAPLDKYVAMAEAKGVDVTGRILPQVRDVVYRPWPDGERHLYGLPEELFVVGLFYNQELFRRAGLPPRAPQDWKEMLEAARRLRALGPDINPLELSSGQGASWNLMSFLWSAGGEAVKEVGPNVWRADFNTPEAVTAYEFYYQLVEGDRLAGRNVGADRTRPRRETVGMFFNYIGNAAGGDLEAFAFGAVPRGPTGIRGSEVNSRVLGVYSQIKDPPSRKPLGGTCSSRRDLKRNAFESRPWWNSVRSGRSIRSCSGPMVTNGI
jgi:ABC-type glycerol-3-phosphate transport system substrate-binding protein